MSCPKCEVCTSHEVASRVPTTPELLLLWLDCGSGNETVSLGVEENLMLSGLVSLRLVAVIYRARRYHGIALCSRACRGPIDAWWYFEQGRSPRALACRARLRRSYPAMSTRTISALVSVSQRPLPYRSFKRALAIHYLLPFSMCF